MRAAVSTRYGPPDVVRVAEVPTPKIGPEDVLVKVHVTTVNRTDCGFRSGKPIIVRAFSGLVRPKATVLGTEFAGQVEAVGDRVTSFQVGDRVFGYSEDRFGAHAQYLAIAQGGPLATIPEGLTYEQAAPSTEASHYALACIRKAKVRAGQRVLVNGATGAIGSAAVQLLRVAGADVTAVADTKNLDLVRSLGAGRVIDRSIEDFTQDRQTYDVVFDAVGKSTFGRCRRLLKPRGLFLTTDLGPGAQNPALAVATSLSRGKKAMLPIPPKFDQELARHFRQLLESGEFKPVIDRRYPLDEIVGAYGYVETGQKVGNVLIVVEPES